MFSTLKNELGDEKFGEIASEVTKDCIYNTAYLTAKYLTAELEDDMDAKVLVLGMEGLRNEI